MTRADRLAGKSKTITGGLCLGRALLSIEELQTHYLWAQSQGPITPPGGGRRRKRKRSTIFLERTRKGHHQSDQYWSCFKGNIEELQGDGMERKWAFQSA